MPGTKVKEGHVFPDQIFEREYPNENRSEAKS
jgi:hypothetical protein